MFLTMPNDGEDVPEQEGLSISGQSIVDTATLESIWQHGVK